MKLDSIALFSVTQEIKKQLIPAKIVDIYQLSRYEMLLVLKNNGVNGNLFFSIQPERTAFFLSRSPLPSENFSSLFFHQLKNWIRGGILLQIEHLQFDRIIKLIIEPYHKFGLPKKYHLIIELMGKYSNAILVDEQDCIRGMMKQVSSDVNRYREIKAGIPYIYPPHQDKLNPLKVNRQEFQNLLNQSRADEGVEYLWQFFHRHFIGYGIKSSQEIVTCLNYPVSQRLNQIPENSWTHLWHQFSELMHRILENRISPVVLIDKKTDMVIDYYLLCAVSQQNTKQLPFQQASSCLEFVFNQLREGDKRQQLYRSINSILKKNGEKLEEKNRFLQNRKREMIDSEIYKKKGELIKAHLWEIRTGTREVDLIDYSDINHPKISVQLKPDISPIENANIYFKRYKKLQQNQGIIEKQLQETNRLWQQLKEFQSALSTSKNSLEELSTLYNQLVRLKYIKKEEKRDSKKKTVQIPYISRFLSPEGWNILVGKNDKQNDYLLRNLSSGNDFWLHHLSRPGSHVIIKNHKNSDNPPYATLILAARLAGYFSKAKDGENAQIIFTRRKYVRKAKNASLGKVIYTNEKIIPVVIIHDEIKKDIQKLLIT